MNRPKQINRQGALEEFPGRPRGIISYGRRMAGDAFGAAARCVEGMAGGRLEGSACRAPTGAQSCQGPAAAAHAHMPMEARAATAPTPMTARPTTRAHCDLDAPAIILAVSSSRLRSARTHDMTRAL